MGRVRIPRQEPSMQPTEAHTPDASSVLRVPLEARVSKLPFVRLRVDVFCHGSDLVVGQSRPKGARRFWRACFCEARHLLLAHGHDRLDGLEVTYAVRGERLPIERLPASDDVPSTCVAGRALGFE